MAKEIYVEPNRVWEYYSAHSTQLDVEEKLLAERTEFGVKVLLSGGAIPSIRVTVDDDELYSEAVIGSHDTDVVAGEIYDKYLSDSVVNILIDDGVYGGVGGLGDFDDGDGAEDEIIEENELQLQEATYDYLTQIAPDFADALSPDADEDELFDDVIGVVCELLYKKYGVSVYRPMYLEDDDGTVSFSEYPYDEMDLDESTTA